MNEARYGKPEFRWLVRAVIFILLVDLLLFLLVESFSMRPEWDSLGPIMLVDTGFFGLICMLMLIANWRRRRSTKEVEPKCSD